MKTKKLLFSLFLFLFIGGCDRAAPLSDRFPFNKNSSLTSTENLPPTSVNSLSLKQCPIQPISPLEKSEEIDFYFSSNVTKSAQVGVGEQIGYTFNSLPNSTFIYKNVTNKPVCVWLFAPNVELLDQIQLNSSDSQTINLPINGIYTIQLVPIRNSSEIEVEMSLNSFTRSQAVNIIRNYLNAKNRIFGDSYNVSLADKYTMGDRNKQIVRGVNDLKKKNKHLKFLEQKLEDYTNVYYSGRQSVNIKATITEKFVTIDQESSESEKCLYYNNEFEFEFKKDNTIWKINDIGIVSRNTLDCDD